MVYNKDMNFIAFEAKIPFSKKISVAYGRLTQYVKRGPWAVFNIVIVSISLGLFVCSSAYMFAESMFAYVKKSGEAPLGVVLILGSLFIAVLGLLIYGINLIGKYIAIMQQFAADNNLEFHPRIKVDDSQGFAFAAKTQRFARNGVTGEVGGKTFWLYEYRFFSGTGRYPYPNIFTVFLIHLDTDYRQALFINKKGRIKILRPRTGLKEVASPWYGDERLRLFTEDGQIDMGVSKLLSTEKVQEILAINPKAEIELKNRSLRILLPEKPIPTKEEAERLFDFAKKL